MDDKGKKLPDGEKVVVDIEKSYLKTGSVLSAIIALSFIFYNVIVFSISIEHKIELLGINIELLNEKLDKQTADRFTRAEFERWINKTARKNQSWLPADVEGK